MTRPRTLDEALDGAPDGGEIDVVERGGRTRVDVVETDRLGVRIRALSVGRGPRDVAREAETLPERLRTLPDRVTPIEVSPELGGAILRTRPESVRRGRFFEVDVRPDETEIRRYRVQGGERTAEDFTLTREQLRDLIDEVRGSG